jgi:hypothetical protein
VTFLLWLLVAATLARPDVIAAIGAGAIAAFVASLRERFGLINYRFRLRWLRHLPRLALQVLQDLVIVGRALLHPRRVQSGFRALPFAIDDDATDFGRRALLGLAASLVKTPPGDAEPAAPR